MRSKVEAKGKARHATIVDRQGTSQGSVTNLREEEKEAKQVREAKEDIKVKVREERKEEERDTKDLAGIAARLVTSQQNAGV